MILVNITIQLNNTGKQCHKIWMVLVNYRNKKGLRPLNNFINK